MIKPVRLNPVYKSYIWGGNRLRDTYGKDSDDSVIAESWELSTHDDGCCTIADGKFKGVTLLEYMKEVGKTILGSKANGEMYSPILVKLIDAADDLSIQVHPGDDYAQNNEGDSGKTEMWVILEAEEGASIYYGVKQNLTEQDVRDSVANGNITDYLNRAEVKKGDVYFIPAGTIHAIGGGLVICEIQQCSNVTYRLYDYKRKDANGDERALHVDKALEVSILTPTQVNSKSEAVLCKDESINIELLRSCQYFNVYRYDIKKQFTLKTSSESFIFLIVTEGTAELCYDGEVMRLGKGDTAFLPAQESEYEVDGRCEMISVML